MNDIYQTPESNLETQNEVPFKPHGFWKVYFWFNIIAIFLVLTASVGFYLMDLGNIWDQANFLDYIDLATTFFLLPTLYGYVYSKKIFFHELWKVLGITYFFWFVFYLAVAPFILGIESYGEPASLDAWFVVETALYIPSCIVMYLYAFKSDHLWNKP
jgi:hypothetical protein